MTIIRNYVLGEFACIGTEYEFILIMKNKVYGPFENNRLGGVLNTLEHCLINGRQRNE